MPSTIFKSISVFLILCLSLQSQAQVVLVPAPQASFTEYKTFLKKEVEFQTPLSVWKKEAFDPHKFKKLYSDFSEAQKTYLDKTQNIKLVIERFKKVTHRAHNEDYPTPERALIFFSFLRLAQLEPHLRNEWILKAASYDWTMDPDKKIFEPALVQEVKKNQNQIITNLTSLSISELKEGDQIYINGRKILKESTHSILVPLDVPMRFTIVSHYREPYSFVGKLREFKLSNSLQVHTSTCEHPDKRLVDQNKAIFYSANCIVMPSQDGFKKVDYLKNLSAQKSYSLTPEIKTSTLLEQALKTEAETPLYKKPLFWAIAGVVLTAVIIVSSQKSKTEERAEPTHTTGR